MIGSGSMYPDVLRMHIQKCKAATDKPFAVNVPMLYPDIDKHIATIVDEKVPIVFTSAGNPGTWTAHLKAHGITVVHVVSSVKFALKAQDAGVDAVVAEGFEAGGHNGREETTTLVLVPMVRDAIQVPLAFPTVARCSLQWFWVLMACRWGVVSFALRNPPDIWRSNNALCRPAKEKRCSP